MKCVIGILLIMLPIQAFSQLDQESEEVKFTKPMRGVFGVSFGTAVIPMKDFRSWSNAVGGGNGIRNNGFFNFTVTGLAIIKHFAYGLTLSHESLFGAGSSGMSPNRTDVAFQFGTSLKDAYSATQILITTGIGFSLLDVNLHGDPPLSLQTKNLTATGSSIWQNAFWLNPKILILKRVGKLKYGVDASVGIYVPGRYRLGYYTGQSKNKTFHGYTMTGVPSMSPINFTIGGFIGF